MTTDQLQLDVQQELKWDPRVDARHVSVIAHEGAVTLSGHVPSYVDKLHAVTAAEHVHGVRAVANDIEVSLHIGGNRDDSDIAESIAHILKWNAILAHLDVKAAVSNGHVSLTGEVDWRFQHDEAERVVSHVLGVTTVTNLITVKLRNTVAQVEKQIANALARHAAVDARQIHVSMSGSTAVLSGHVHSVDEARVAKEAAWAAPGVFLVDDHLLAIHP